MKKQYNDTLIKRFINFELTNNLIVSDLLSMCKNENLIIFEYECNMYNVCLDRKDGKVTIKDSVSEEHGVAQEYTRFKLDLNDFILLLKD